jgi:ABC-type maltose transport system permease subunit
MSAVVIGVLLSVLGLFGLVLAGGAIDTGMYHFGLALFAFAFFFDLWLIKTYFDRLDAR